MPKDYTGFTLLYDHVSKQWSVVSRNNQYVFVIRMGAFSRVANNDIRDNDIVSFGDLDDLTSQLKFWVETN